MDGRMLEVDTVGQKGGVCTAAFVFNSSRPVASAQLCSVTLTYIKLSEVMFTYNEYTSLILLLEDKFESFEAQTSY